MNVSAFRDLGARVMFEKFQNITSDHKSRAALTISYDFLIIIYLTRLLSRRLFFELFVLEFFSFGVYFSFSHLAFNVFLFFAFSSSFSTMFWFDKADQLSAIFFFIWRFPSVSMATSVLHCITSICAL